MGAEFYFSEEDYLAQQDAAESKRKVRIKTEPTFSDVPCPSSSSLSLSLSSKGRKRPRRAAAAAAAAARSYIVPDSDDEAIVDEDAECLTSSGSSRTKRVKVESN